MKPDKVDAGWVKKAAPAPAQESAGERRRPQTGVKREQGVKQEAGQGSEISTGAAATRLQTSGIMITFSTDLHITIIQDVPGYPKEELSERDIIMINRGMEIRRQSDHHGFPPLDVAAARPRPGYQWPSGGYSPAALDRVNICTPPYLRYSPHHTLHPAAAGQQTLGQVGSSDH